MIGHPMLRQSYIHLPWALGKYILCDNKPHLEKEKSGRTCCKGMAERRSLPSNLLHLSQDLANLYESRNIVGQK
jgi:hypothetical protein